MFLKCLFKHLITDCFGMMPLMLRNLLQPDWAAAGPVGQWALMLYASQRAHTHSHTPTHTHTHTHSHTHTHTERLPLCMHIRPLHIIAAAVSSYALHSLYHTPCVHTVCIPWCSLIACIVPFAVIPCVHQPMCIIHVCIVPYAMYVHVYSPSVFTYALYLTRRY